MKNILNEIWHTLLCYIALPLAVLGFLHLCIVWFVVWVRVEIGELHKIEGDGDSELIKKENKRK